MKSQANLLYVGLADFTPRALVILGNEQSLAWLSEQIAGRQHFCLKDFPANARIMNIGDLEIVPTTDRSELRQRQDQTLVWTIASADAGQYSEQLKALADSTRPSHAYLDFMNGSDFEFIVSKDEYDPATLFV